MELLATATFFVPHVLLVVAAIGAAVSYVRPIEPRIHPALGLAAIAALLLFILYFGTWSGYPTRADLQYFAFAGLLPYSDAANYYLGSFDVGYSGIWGYIPSTRPLAAAFRDVVTALGGISYRPTLVAQALITSAAITFAAWRVSRWIGPWSALGFIAFAVILARPFLGTAATETLGLVWSLIAIGFLADALRTRSFPAALLAILCTNASQFTRTGAIFLVPALMLWALVAHGQRGTWLRNTALICAAAVGPYLFSILLGALYGAKDVPQGWNMSFLLCGLARGTSWYECRDVVAAAGLGRGDIASYAAALYKLAWDAFTADPTVLLRGLLSNITGFVSYAPQQMIGGINLHLGFMRPYSDYMMLLALPGLAIHLWRAPKSEWLLWSLGVLAICASATFLWSYDGWRTLYATHAFMALPLVIGLRSGLPTFEPINIRLAASALGAVAVALLAAPALLQVVLAAPKTQFYESRSIAGFLVVADDAPAPRAPYLRQSQFLHVMTLTRMEDEHGPFLSPTLAALPRSVFFATRQGHARQGTALFIGPPEILLRGDVPLWSFTLSQPAWGKQRSPLRIVESAEPAK